MIKRQGHGARETFTVRKQSFGVGVERTFPLHSPKIERIEVAAAATCAAPSCTTCATASASAPGCASAAPPAPRWPSSASCCTGPRPVAEAPADDAEQVGEAPRPQPAERRAEPSPPSRRAAARRARQPPAKSRCDRRPRSRLRARPVELVADRRGRARPRAGDPGLHRQALRDPQRLDAADAAHQPAGAGRPHRHRISPPRRSATSSSFTRRPARAAPIPNQGDERRPASSRPSLRRRAVQALLADLHQARGRPARRSALDPRRARVSATASASRTRTPCPARATASATSAARSSSPRATTT